MRKEEKILREQLLNGVQAHMTFDEAIADFPIEKINDIFPNGSYSAWDLLEHIRITQEDILEFIVNPNYKDKEWPKDYWPEKGKKASNEEWHATIKKYHRDCKSLEEIIKNPQTNLYAKIPHGNGQTILREIFLVTDHTSYHMGEFAIMRQVMGTWK